MREREVEEGREDGLGERVVRIIVILVKPIVLIIMKECEWGERKAMTLMIMHLQLSWPRDYDFAYVSFV